MGDVVNELAQFMVAARRDRPRAPWPSAASTQSGSSGSCSRADR
jgi:hypothetical protein